MLILHRVHLRTALSRAWNGFRDFLDRHDLSHRVGDDLDLVAIAAAERDRLLRVDILKHETIEEGARRSEIAVPGNVRIKRQFVTPFWDSRQLELAAFAPDHLARFN